MSLLQDTLKNLDVVVRSFFSAHHFGLCPTLTNTLHTQCVKISHVCVIPRGDLPADGSGDSGGTGLVSGSAGDHSDAPLSQRDGLQQGVHTSKQTFPFTVSISLLWL